MFFASRFWEYGGLMYSVFDNSATMYFLRVIE